MASNREVFINHRLVLDYNGPGGVSKCQYVLSKLALTTFTNTEQ